jgi:hypothetical protein
MLDFLSAGQRDSVLKLFGPNTEAGRQLRQIFGASQRKTSQHVKYPVVTVRKNHDRDQKPPKIKPPRMRQFKRKSESPEKLSLKPGRRPASIIQAELDSWTFAPHIDTGEDLSQDKHILQERFEFYDPEITAPSREDIEALKRQTKQRTNTVVDDIIEAQKDLEKCIDRYEKLDLENRIERGIKELKLLSSS